MAENTEPLVTSGVAESPVVLPTTVDDARRMAKERFKERLAKGEKVGDCACHDPDANTLPTDDHGVNWRVVGARFIDSGQVYFFDPGGLDLALGDWIVVSTSRGHEAAKVVIAPNQVAASQLKGDLKRVERRLSERDITKMESLRKESASALRTFGAMIRARHLPMKPISAEYNFDGSSLTLNFSAAERVDFRELARELGKQFRCRVELRQVSARDEAKLLGGLGRCGRTLCCSTWLPMFPDISMGMAKTQDLSLNPSKVSGVCGRLLCCLSYENEQYRQLKAVMPKLAQKIETPLGSGTVVSLQLLKGVVTVLLDSDNQPHQFSARELGFGEPAPAPVRMQSPKRAEPDEVRTADEAESVPSMGPDTGEDVPRSSGSRSSRRRRRKRNRGQHGAADPGAGEGSS